MGKVLSAANLDRLGVIKLQSFVVSPEPPQV